MDLTILLQICCDCSWIIGVGFSTCFLLILENNAWVSGLLTDDFTVFLKYCLIGVCWINSSKVSGLSFPKISSKFNCSSTVVVCFKLKCLNSAFLLSLSFRYLSLFWWNWYISSWSRYYHHVIFQHLIQDISCDSKE